MNYRHAYHAGNHGDVLKHAVLVAILERLREKPSPFFALDTHAGVGLYDLNAAEADKTEEWRGGIGRLAEADPPALQSYLEIVRGLNSPGALARYPGSPAIVARAMRPGDRLVLNELHPEDCFALRGWARGNPAIAVHRRDGYEILKAMLPPPEGRGLVVVDPPYEAWDEFARLAKAVVAGARRWPGGRWLIWYPIKDRAPIWRFEEEVLAAGLTNLLSVELTLRPVDGVGLAGSGILLVNPPFGLEAWLDRALPQLRAALAPGSIGEDGHGSHAWRRLDRS
jgi:23S rRNA (adenine2030-N6)-methyltransferase